MKIKYNVIWTIGTIVGVIALYTIVMIDTADAISRYLGEESNKTELLNKNPNHSITNYIPKPNSSDTIAAVFIE